MSKRYTRKRKNAYALPNERLTRARQNNGKELHVWMKNQVKKEKGVMSLIPCPAWHAYQRNRVPDGPRIGWGLNPKPKERHFRTWTENLASRRAPETTIPYHLQCDRTPYVWRKEERKYLKEEKEVTVPTPPQGAGQLSGTFRGIFIGSKSQFEGRDNSLEPEASTIQATVLTPALVTRP